MRCRWLAWAGVSSAIAMAIAGCRREAAPRARAEDAGAGARVDAGVDAAAVNDAAAGSDAIALGPLDHVRARFDRECPPSVPAYPIEAAVTIVRHPRSWVCTLPWPRPAAWPREAPPPGPRRVVALELIDRGGVPAVAGIAIGYRDTRERGAAALPCRGLVDELIAYAEELRPGGIDRAAVRTWIEDDGRFCEARVMASPARPAGR